MSGLVAVAPVSSIDGSGAGVPPIAPASLLSTVDRTWSQMTEQVSTLRQAHELLHREWPGPTAPVATWLTYHRRAAALYAHVAKVDAGHYHEALYWVGVQEQAAQELVDRDQPKGDSDGE